ncbi:MAG: type II TA system antitoxin MqsA family protein [Acidiferrobacteraceae bacterium]
MKCPCCGAATLINDTYKVRKKLGLTQRQAGEIFGGGVTAFSRYENGKIKPSVPLVKLLKLLDHHPDLLAEIRAEIRKEGDK